MTIQAILQREPSPALPPTERPRPNPDAVSAVARHLSEFAAHVVQREIVEYSARNGIPAEEVFVRATSARNKLGTVHVELAHEANGSPIIGSPKRQFVLDLSLKIK